jgi:hypothetical protein
VSLPVPCGVMHPVNHLSSQTLRGDTTSTCDRIQGRALTSFSVVVVVVVVVVTVVVVIAVVVVLVVVVYLC